MNGKNHSINAEDYLYVFKVIQEVSDEGYLLIDPNGIVVEINEAYAEFLGRSRTDSIGKHVKEIISNTEMIEVMKHSRRDIHFVSVIDQLEINPESKDKISSITRSVVKNDRNETIGALAQVKFRNQILKHAKSLNALYKVLSSHTEDLVDKVNSEKEVIEESNKIKKLQLQIEYYKNELRETNERKPSYAIGTSPNYVEVKTKALRAAKNSFSVLITGETGTGKEIMADYIHWFSDRSNNPLIKVNCAAIPSELFESELFGYEKGAFTGSRQSGKKGKFALADKGTIFLDEIGDLPLNMQTKLLRVLQDGILEPIGAEKPVQIDVRVISATNKDLEELVKNKLFRQDLYYRLNEIKLELPRLADRKCDIIPLAQHFLNILNWKYETSVILSPEITKYFLSYSWPGNIRELNNVIKTAYSSIEGEMIQPSNLPAYMTSNIPTEIEILSYESGKTLEEYLSDCERNFIIKILENNNGNLTKTANALGIHRSNLYTKMGKHKITKSELKPPQ